MDKKSNRYKKSRHDESSSSSDDSSGSSDSSYTSSDSDRGHRRKKKFRSSSERDERRKEKKEHCQKKLEAKRNHIKRKLKEAKLKKKAAAAVAALNGHSHRALSPATQAKLKKLAERKHLRAASKERREREREKHRAAREREREHHRADSSRSPTKITKIRIHQDVKRQKSPPRMHHQLMSREKIIIQTRTHRTPSAERERAERERLLRHEHKMRHHEERRDRERERAEREAARDKERAEAIARQERQRERERMEREKIRRDEERKYGAAPSTSLLDRDRGERLLPRPAEREMAIAAARGYSSRERSLDPVDARQRHLAKRDVDIYEREREYMESERRGVPMLDRDDLRRERDFLSSRRREISPVSEHMPSGSARMRDPRDIYPEEERERSYSRPYLEEVRPRERESWLDVRERDIHEPAAPSREPREYVREHEHAFVDERERRDRERPSRAEWKSNEWESSALQREARDWNNPSPPTLRGGFAGSGSKRGGLAGATKIAAMQHKPPREASGANSEPDWDVDEMDPSSSSAKLLEPTKRTNAFAQSSWNEHETPAPLTHREKLERRWPLPSTTKAWNDNEESTHTVRVASHRGRGRGFRRGGGGGAAAAAALEHRSHPPSLLNLNVTAPGSFHASGNPRFALNRNLTYTNPNIIKKQQAVASAKAAIAAAKAAAQSAANATTNPGILGQVRHHITFDDKPEAGEIADDIEDKAAGELSEISDSDDDILNKTDKKSKPEEAEIAQEKLEITANDDGSKLTANNDNIAEDNDFKTSNDDDEMLDFEEISDGELEEQDARNKGVGDALGVDWASLIAETKKNTENCAPNGNEFSTTAKQKWQPHRILLDIGISMKMAGKEYAKCLLQQAQQKLNEEILNKEEVKVEQKQDSEQVKTENIDGMANENADSHLIANEIKPEKNEDKSLKPKVEDGALNVEALPEIACLQVAERQRAQFERKLFAISCGGHLSARLDLQLRRQLCGLPPREMDLPARLPEVSSKIKSLALSVFQRAMEVK